MRLFNLENDFIRGWIVGAFDNPIMQTDKFEVCIKHFKKGDVEKLHHHKLTHEITVIISGKVKMCEKILQTNDIIVLEPSEWSSFECLEDAITCAIRNGSFPKDKYEI